MLIGISIELAYTQCHVCAQMRTPFAIDSVSFSTTYATSTPQRMARCGAMLSGAGAGIGSASV